MVIQIEKVGLLWIYKDSLINYIDVLSNGEIINYRYAKINLDERSQLIEDHITSKYMHMNFIDSNIKDIYLKGMATTKLNLVQDTLLQGLNKATGDSIIINPYSSRARNYAWKPRM